MNPSPISNAHHSMSRISDTKPDMSAQFNLKSSYNFALANDRSNDRYTPAISSKLNYFDQSRVVEPMLVFGTQYSHWKEQKPMFSPAGMDMDVSRKMTGLAFTKPVKKMYAQNC